MGQIPETEIATLFEKYVFEIAMGLIGLNKWAKDIMVPGSTKEWDLSTGISLIKSKLKDVLLDTQKKITHHFSWDKRSVLYGILNFLCHE